MPTTHMADDITVEELQAILAEGEPTGEQPANEPVQPAAAAPLTDRERELVAKAKHWRGKAVDPATGKAYKTLLEEQRATAATAAAPSQFATREELADIKLGNAGLDSSTVEFVKTFAKGAGIDPVAALDAEPVKEFIAARKAKQALERATPASGSRGPAIVGGKAYADMTPAERAANFEQVRKQAIGK